jgi:hypothetical protein
LAKADVLTCLNVSPHTMELKIALEAKTSAVEHAGAQGVSPAEAHLPCNTLMHQLKPMLATQNVVLCPLKGGPKTH